LMYKDGTQAIIDKYEQLATHSVTEATPKVVNAFRPRAALFSCCLVRPSDSLEGINESINMLAKESKYSGGTAWDSSLIRGPGAYVEGNNGTSSGSKPYIQALQAVVGSYNQGNTRSAACINTFDAFHYESPEHAHLKHESGKDEDRARKLQYSVKWNSHLSKAVLQNDDIYLMDPHKTQDLFNSFGEQWRELYEKYSRNNHIHKRKYNARELAFEFVRTAFETGNMYFFFSDNANEQDIGAGFIPASNLCIAKGELVTTNRGDIPIEEVLVGDKVISYNEETKQEESKRVTASMQTGTMKVMRITDTKTGCSLKCTPNHKIWTENRGYVEAGKLEVTDEVRIISTHKLS